MPMKKKGENILGAKAKTVKILNLQIISNEGSAFARYTFKFSTLILLTSRLSPRLKNKLEKKKKEKTPRSQLLKRKRLTSATTKILRAKLKINVRVIRILHVF